MVRQKDNHGLEVHDEQRSPNYVLVAHCLSRFKVVDIWGRFSDGFDAPFQSYWSLWKHFLRRWTFTCEGPTLPQRATVKPPNEKCARYPRMLQFKMKTNIPTRNDPSSSQSCWQRTERPVINEESKILVVLEETNSDKRERAASPEKVTNNIPETCVTD